MNYKKPLFVLLFFFSLPFALLAQHNDAVNIDVQKKFIKKEIKKIKKENVNNLPIAELELNEIPEYAYCSYRLLENSRIVLRNGDWVSIFLHSSHQNGKVGDVSIAVSSKGKIYVNYGHICGGGINFESIEAKIPIDERDFFSRFKSDTDDATWIKWK